jgi:hypothetical protein
VIGDDEVVVGGAILGHDEAFRQGPMKSKAGG